MNAATSLRSRWLAVTAIGLLAVAAFGLVALPAHYARTRLGEPSIVTGYSLFTLILLLALFNVRKKIPMLPLIAAHWWTTAHVLGGILCTALFWLHTGSLWPIGSYERLLAALFYVVTLSGIVGYAIERVYPRRLTGTGLEVIYERIPSEIADLREQAETLVLECTRTTKSDTVARYYVETFDWFFRRPRFFLNHLTGGYKSAFWLEQRFASSRQYVNETEQSYLERLERLAENKNKIDFNYSAQWLMKSWLLVHVPSAGAMLVLAVWHLLVVHIYAL